MTQYTANQKLKFLLMESRTQYQLSDLNKSYFYGLKDLKGIYSQVLEVVYIIVTVEELELQGYLPYSQR